MTVGLGVSTGRATTTTVGMIATADLIGGAGPTNHEEAVAMIAALEAAIVA